MDRIVLTAASGMILTDGETFGRKIYLAKGESADRYYEISEEEYSKITEPEEI